MCAGPIAYIGHEALGRDLANLRAAKDQAAVEEAFVASIAPGSLEMFCRGQNSHYPAPEPFFEAIAAAMREEYRAMRGWAGAGNLRSSRDGSLASLGTKRRNSSFTRWRHLA